jgi:transposase
VDLPLYAALEPTTGESFCLYLPGMDRGCLQSFLEGLSEAYPDHHLLVVLDGAPSHRSEEIVYPENVDFLRLPAYSPELDPVERWFQEFRRELSNPRPLRPSSYCNRRSAKRFYPTGRSLLAYDSSLVSPGGWRPLMRCDINNPDRYYPPLDHLGDHQHGTVCEAMVVILGVGRAINVLYNYVGHLPRGPRHLPRRGPLLLLT